MATATTIASASVRTETAARIPAGETAADDDIAGDRASATTASDTDNAGTRRQEESEVISLVRVILEREIARVGPKGAGREPLEKLLDLIRKKDNGRLRESYRYLISQVENPTEELERAREILAKMLANS